jgi:hypothetical protein
MSSLSFRSALTGVLVVSFLSLAVSRPGEAADLTEAPAAPAVLTLAWQWLTAQIFPVDETTGAMAVAVAPGQSTVDAGWVIDPDG